MLTQQKLKELLHYDPETGIFTWIGKSARNTIIGTVAGGPHATGYINIGIVGKRIGAHRLAILYMYGHMPKDEVDHINGVRDDNRIANLREATRAENKQNLHSCNRRNITGLLGVSVNGVTFAARIRVNGKQIYLGTFRKPQDAYEAYMKAKRDLHPFCVSNCASC